MDDRGNAKSWAELWQACSPARRVRLAVLLAGLVIAIIAAVIVATAMALAVAGLLAVGH